MSTRWRKAARKAGASLRRSAVALERTHRLPTHNVIPGPCNLCGETTEHDSATDTFACARLDCHGTWTASM